jgi:hypothetical protein
MKRALHFVLLMLTMLSTIEASAATKKKSKHPKKIPAVVEHLYQAEPGPAIALLPRPTPEMSRMGIRSQSAAGIVTAPGPVSGGPPTEISMRGAGSTQLDLRLLPQTPPVRQERPEREAPDVTPVPIGTTAVPRLPSLPAQSAPAPSTLVNFPGLDFNTWGAGHPPDTVGDVGPSHYIQAVNTSIGIYSKSGGAPLAAFTFNTFMAQGHFGNLCDTNNFGDPVILYDTFEDRWVITDFAFVLDGGSNVVNPPGSFQCFAVSKSGDPLAGGWNFYSLHMTDALNDYPKFGIWPDGIYMSANMFGFPATGSFQGTRVWALNKAQMYAGASNIQVVQFNPPSSEFTMLPSNARLQAGTPPPGSPNYFSTVWNFTNAVSTYEFHVDWNRISLSTFSGPFLTTAPASWVTAPATVPAKGGSNNDTLDTRLMMQNQYTNLGGVESLWQTHTVGNPSNSGVSAVRYYQTNVTGGSVDANTTQAFTHAPDTTNRYMPSVAVDRAGNMALGYSASTSTLFPAIRYAGRLFADPVDSLPQTETSLIEGTGSQTSITRWGDYSAMSLDPDGCRFWFTNEYYATTGVNWQTRVGSFSYGPPSGSFCTPVSTGTVSGTVTATSGGAPIASAAVSFGSRTTTTNGSGLYSFTLVPSGTYPGITVSAPGFDPSTATNIVVTDGTTTTQDFSLSAAATSGCLVDTNQADFQTGIATNTDLTSSAGDVILLNPATLDQQNTNLSGTGAGIDTLNWGGQTFTAGLTGPLARVDVSLFCFTCTGTFPNLTLSLRATSGNLPTGPDLATTTLPGSSSGASSYVTGIFDTPATVTAGTVYALVVRPVAEPSAGTYAVTISSLNPYANGQRLSSGDSGSTWAGASTDLGFKTFVKTGFSSSGDFVSATKDANPAPGMTPIWSTLSWTSTVPANTSLKFQVAASNAAAGPFNFAGPDGTAATFFTSSGASLSQFFGFRYLQYKAYMATTDATQTPTLSDVTICYTVADCSAPITITPAPAQACASSAGNTASGPAGAASYSWSISNGTIVGSAASQSVTYTAGASGSVGLTLNIVEAGGCHKPASTNVAITPLPATPAITPGGPTAFCIAGSVTLTSSSASGDQWYLDGNPIGGATAQTYIATASGNYTVIVTTGSCSSVPSAATVVTVSPIPPTPTITPGGPTTFCGGSSVMLTSSSASGNQWYLDGNPIGGATNQSYSAIASGNYTVVVTTGGCSSAPSAATSVTVNPTPAAPTITPGGPTTFCTGGSVTLTSSIASGDQWLLNGNPIVGATNQTYNATASGSYTVTVTTTGCVSAPSDAISVTVNPIPPAPTVTPSGPTTFCPGGSVTLTSSSAVGNQWLLDANPIVGATSQTYNATASGTYTVTVTASGCTSAASTGTTVTVNPIPAAPTITPGGPTTFCAGSSVTLTSSSAAGNQWFLNGNPIGSATNQTFVATASGNYTVTTTTAGCISAPSAARTVTANPNPNATIAASATVVSGSTGNTASVANAGAGATYTWGVTGGTITAGAGTSSITFTAGGPGTLTLSVTVTTAAGCSDAKSANINVVLPTVTVTSVSPANGVAAGGTPVTINGTGFASGASVTFGGTAATNVVVVSTIKITAKTPAHSTGSVNVTVTNTDTSTGTMNSGYLYLTQLFDPNNDNLVDSSDIFYLVNFLFLDGPPPHGPSGLSSGDANGDGHVDSSDIFYLVNFLFLSGPKPSALPNAPRGTAVGTESQQIAGSISLGKPVPRAGHFIVPVVMTISAGSIVPQAMALRVHFHGEGTMGEVTARKAGVAKDVPAVFEVSRRSGDDLSYLVSYDPRGLALGVSRSAIVAEIEIESADANASLSIDPLLTMLSDQTGTMTATVANGKLEVSGTTIRSGKPPRSHTDHDVN